MKPGDIVTHQTYGVGEVREVRMMGREAYVHFHIGIILQCPVRELRTLGTASQVVPPRPDQLVNSVKNEVASAHVSANAPEVKTSLPTLGDSNGSRAAVGPVHAEAEPVRATTLPPTPPRRVVTDDEQFEARQVVEALRLGVVPRFRIDEFTIGLKSERKRLRSAFDAAESEGGDARALVGEYGSGKSHIFEWTAAEALRRGYLVATASLDVFETPPSKPFRIYNALVKSLRYPDRTDGGSLAPLFEKFLADEDYESITREMRRKHPNCSLLDALTAYTRCVKRDDSRGGAVVLNWIAAEKVPVTRIREAARQVVEPIRQFTTVADQYCYLLTGVSWLARQAGYKGLLVLIDESEHYSLLTTTMKERADVFFQGMIYASLGRRQSRIKPCKKEHGIHCWLPHGGHRPFPFRYSKDAGLVFMFATTTSDISLDYESWLDDEKVLRLNNRLRPGDVEELFARIYVTHSRAFGYESKEAFTDVGAKLVGAYESGLINLRELIRHSTEVFDLIYTRPGYGHDELVRDIERAFP